ncbi:hypothetical protein O6H91_09G033000 [Diphasiastrum complanatum]|uniref:Uncharacterized protein n=1 Tax=Diphasiastrum complanatum TaxID=34168 RepID=A0ACC2CN36_DIPCM|nr:hypothetical protein O6H91_09G033000 [Diphasiastrum complanatum]
MMMDTSSSSKPNESLGWLEMRHRVSDSQMQELESCVANLYETISSKVTATRMILESAKRIDCLAHLAYHASAMCALARVLREEGHKSFDLRLNIISVIFITSFFQNFHKILLEQNIGRTTIQFLMFEIENMEYHHKLSNTSRVTSLHSKETMAWKSEQERVMYMSINVLFNLAKDINIQRKMKKYNLVELLCQVLDIRDLRLQLIQVLEEAEYF